MTTNTKKIIASAASAALLAVVPACTSGEKHEYKYMYRPPTPKDPPTILAHPETQVVLVGSDVSFSVQAENPPVTDIPQHLEYKWKRLSLMTKKNPVVVDAPGVNTKRTYPIQNVTTNDVGFYFVSVTSKNGKTDSEPACLLVYTTNSPLTVYGSPVAVGGDVGGTCPGKYAGYVNYKKSVAQGWGWAPDHNAGNTIHSAADNTRSDTKVEAVGNADDRFCGQTSVPNTHAGSPAPEDTKFRFTIYFTNNVPTSSYPITLNGFLP